MYLAGNPVIPDDDKFSSWSEATLQTTSGKPFENLLSDRSNTFRLLKFTNL